MNLEWIRRIVLMLVQHRIKSMCDEDIGTFPFRFRIKRYTTAARKEKPELTKLKQGYLII